MNYLKKIWRSIMDSSINPLSNIIDIRIRHMVMQILAFMWSAVFSLYIFDALYIFKFTAIAHALLIAAVFITAFTFNRAKNKPEIFDHKFFRGKDGEHE